MGLNNIVSILTNGDLNDLERYNKIVNEEYLKKENLKLILIEIKSILKEINFKILENKINLSKLDFLLNSVDNDDLMYLIDDLTKFILICINEIKTEKSYIKYLKNYLKEKSLVAVKSTYIVLSILAYIEKERALTISGHTKHLKDIIQNKPVVLVNTENTNSKILNDIDKIIIKKKKVL